MYKMVANTELSYPARATCSLLQQLQSLQDSSSTSESELTTTMTVTTPLDSMVHHMAQLVLEDTRNPSPQSHFELLQMIEQIRLAVETPTETVLRLIYQVLDPFKLRLPVDRS